LAKVVAVRIRHNACMVSEALSVIIPVYNRSRLLPRAIHSALAAIESGDEVIVVDDGSTDDSAAVAESFGAPVRVLTVRHGGAGAARNAGIDAAKGPLLAFLDSDDEWRPNKVVLQRRFLEARPDVLYACSDFAVHVEDGPPHSRHLTAWLRPPRPLAEVFGPGIAYSSVAELPPGSDDFDVYIGDMYLEEMRNNFIAAFTLMVRKDQAEEALHFADDLPICEEWPAFGRLCSRGPGAVFDTETAMQHKHSGPRLTDASADLFADSWLTTLEQVWGEDEEFLTRHGEEYRQVVFEAQLMKAISLARGGSMREARRAVRLAARHPGVFRAFWSRSMAQRRLHVDTEAPSPSAP
jgi:glycosyltransferase involved in cell wall biosynthesis